MTTSHVGWMHIWRLGERARRATVGPEGTIHKDEKMVRRGFYTMKDAVAAWPEFSYFTAGYAASTQPVDSERFREALEDQWRNLDVCTGEKVDRPYRAVLEERIARAATNVEAFRRPEPAPGAPS